MKKFIGLLLVIFYLGCFLLFLFAQGNILDESFEGAGYENVWNETVGGGSTVDEDNTDIARPAGGEAQVLKIQKVSPNFQARTHYDDLPNEYDTAYATFYVHITAEGLANNEEIELMGGYNSVELVWVVRVQQTSNELQFKSTVYNNGGWETATTGNINTGQWYRIDFKYDTGSTWELRLDETPIDSATVEGSLKTSAGYWRLGDGPNSETITMYIDLVNIDSTGYVSFGNGEENAVFIGANFLVISLLFIVARRKF